MVKLPRLARADVAQGSLMSPRGRFRANRLCRLTRFSYKTPAKLKILSWVGGMKGVLPEFGPRPLVEEGETSSETPPQARVDVAQGSF